MSLTCYNYSQFTLHILFQRTADVLVFSSVWISPVNIERYSFEGFMRLPDDEIRLNDSARSGVFVSREEATSIFSDLPNVLSAIDFAEQMHASQARRNGNSYLEGHLLPAAVLTARYLVTSGDTAGEIEEKVITALLHDAVEDCDVSCEMVLEALGQENAELAGIVFENIQALTKPHRANFPDPDNRAEEYRNKMLERAKEKPWIIDLKCLDNILNLTEDLNILRMSEFDVHLGKIKSYIVKSYTRYSDLFRESSQFFPVWVSRIESLVSEIYPSSVAGGELIH